MMKTTTMCIVVSNGDASGGRQGRGSQCQDDHRRPYIGGGHQEGTVRECSRDSKVNAWDFVGSRLRKVTRSGDGRGERPRPEWTCEAEPEARDMHLANHRLTTESWESDVRSEDPGLMAREGLPREAFGWVIDGAAARMI
jgi:hypothetical protein